jgi:hypothetical protein
MGLVFEFVDSGFNSSEIYNSLKPLVIEAMAANNLHIPDEWVLLFQAGYTNARIPLVSKNKIGGYPSEKMKYITIIVPIPLESEINWGVKPEQHLYGKDHYDNLMKNFFELAVDYRNYDNRTDYVTACLKAGIKKVFEEGFTVGGVKLKAEQPIEI